MVRAVERIEQELARLEQSVTMLAQEFHDTYSQYLTALGQAVRQQLILASYHLCTHGYPEQFLQLSLKQRQQLQQSLRQLTKTAQSTLLDRLQSVAAAKSSFKPSPSNPLDELRSLALEGQFTIEEIAIGNVELASASDLFNIALSKSSGLPESSNPESSNPESSNPEPANSEQIAPEPPVDLSASAPSQAEPSPLSEQPQSELRPSESPQADLPQAESLPSPSTPSPSESLPIPEPESTQPQPLQPRDILYWQEQLEEGIIEELQNLSHAANRLLQQAEILPGRLPEPVLEVAAKADFTSESAASLPNLLNLLIESEEGDKKASTMTQLMAIRLRLSEIEFSDSASTLWRSKIRDLSSRLNKLGREYQKKQKERSIAQAEAAWRSSWYED
jgi:hypothetical protein